MCEPLAPQALLLPSGGESADEELQQQLQWVLAPQTSDESAAACVVALAQRLQLAPRLQMAPLVQVRRPLRGSLATEAVLEPQPPRHRTDDER